MKILNIKTILVAGLLAYTFGGESHVWLKGDSTLHPYSSTATVITADIQTEAIGSDVASQKIKSFDVTIPVEGLKSGEKGLDKNMHKTLKAAEYPNITFHLLSDHFVSAPQTETSFPINVEGTLTVAGKEIKLPIEAQASMTPKGIRFQGEKKLLMTDFGIKPPTMMGVIKTRNEVTVGFDLILEPK